MREQELLKGPVVERAVGRVEQPEGERAADDACPVGGREQPVARERRAEVRRCGHAGHSAQPRPLSVGAQHRDVQSRLQVRHRLGVETGQQPPVSRTAAQEDVLAVVDRESVAFEGESRTAEPGAAFEQHDLAAGVGEAQCGGDAGQAATDDDRTVVRHVASRPGRVRAARPAASAGSAATRARA